MLGVDEQQFAVIRAAARWQTDRLPSSVGFIRAEKKIFAYLFGRELYQGTFVALKGRKEKRERWETRETAAKILRNTAYTEVS